MSIANYADLIAGVATWLSRADLTTQIPQGIVLAESKMNRKLRTKDMEIRNAAFQITGEIVPVPPGFGGVRMWHLNDNPRSIISMMTNDEMTMYYGDGSPGDPVHYTVEGANFRVQPTPSTTTSSTLVYFTQVPALTAQAPTNWVMTSHPDAYLYGVNAEMCGIMKDWQGMQTWESMMYTVLGEIVAAATKDKWSGATLMIRPG